MQTLVSIVLVSLDHGAVTLKYMTAHSFARKHRGCLTSYFKHWELLLSDLRKTFLGFECQLCQLLCKLLN